jgi:hypothetical protein
MRKTLFLLVALSLLWTSSLAAETIRIGPGMVMELTLPGARWTITPQAPHFLLEETAEHLEHELAGQGKQLDSAKLKAAAAKRLSVNEAFVYNSESGAVLTIDFSPLREGEDPPGRKTVAASARYAGESLAGEEGYGEVDWESGKTRVEGARHAYRVDARYRYHGEPAAFVGVIGFARPYWFFFYYTDPLKDPRDAVEMGTILESVVLRVETVK